MNASVTITFATIMRAVFSHVANELDVPVEEIAALDAQEGRLKVETLSFGVRYIFNPRYYELFAGRFERDSLND